MLEGMLAAQPQEGAALFVDMNSFFASVEQQEHPELRGRPVGVCPFINDNTCIIAASIEAKRFGVKTGTPIPEARQLCPDIILLGDNPANYRDYHRRIMEALNDTRCRVHPKSIDEAFLVVPRDLRGDAVSLAHDIKARVWSIGSQLSCSIGIAPNQFLAKMGSNFKKPNGLTIIRTEELEHFYSQLRLTDLHGVASRMAQRLHELDIYTPVDFFQAPYAKLARAFGANGQAWYLRLRGYEVDQRPTIRRTIGHETTIVPAPARSLDQVLSTASQLVSKAATRLRGASFGARGIAVHLRYTDRTHWEGHHRGKLAFTDTASFYAHVRRILERAPLDKPVRLVGVTAFDLVPNAALPGTLFDLSSRDDRISQAVDLIESRFGRRSILPARQLLAPIMKDRVGFGNSHHVTMDIPD